MSSADDFQRIEELFNRAIDLPESSRASFLQRECPSDPETRQRVMRLIEKAESTTEPGLLLPPVIDSDDMPEDESPGAMIGRYLLRRRVGDGGMGVVFEAEQSEPVSRRVALKLIKLGMDTRQLLARFGAERQVLARMQHPNIAAFFDAGATDRGRPYFVMEFIDGTAITTYCDEQTMNLRDRLVLFLQVCDAVQHAHQKGVIHRDLKPANVQVTQENGRALVKIIDFGIARVIAEPTTGTLATRVGQVVGTPEYMSPEQLASEGTDVDTRADVYALGVILYELLTGALPRRSVPGAGGEAADDLRRPSARVASVPESAPTSRQTTRRALSRSLQSELDWIVLNALHPERERRYLSAAELGADLRRYLDGRPVHAGPETLRYRFNKFVRRNRISVSAAAAVAAALIIAVIFSSRYALQAERERAEASRQTRIATAVNSFLNEDLLAYADPKVDPDREVTLREIVDRSAGTLGERFDDEPLVEAMIRMTLGRTYESLGEINLAEEHFRRALDIRQSTLGDASADTLETAVGLAGLLYQAGKYEEGLAVLSPAIVIIERTLPEDDAIRLFSINTLASLYDGLGRWDEALATYERAVEVHEAVLGRHHIETLTAINNLAITLAEERRFDEAQPLLEEVLDVRRRDLGSEHPDTILSMGSVAFGHMQLADYESAEPLLAEATELGRRVLGNSHWWQANNLGLLGQVYLMNRKPEQAESVTVEGIEALSATLGLEHPIVVGLNSGLAMTLAALGEHDRAAALIDAVVANYEENYGAADPRTHRMLFRRQWIERMAGRCEAAGEIIAALPPEAIERMRDDAELGALASYSNRCD